MRARTAALTIAALAGALPACGDSETLGSPRRGLITTIVSERSFNRVTSLAIGPDGSIYVGGRGGANVYPVEGEGRPLYRTAHDFMEIRGIALGNNLVYLSDHDDRTVKAITPNGGVLNVAGNGDWAIPPDGAPAAHSPLACPAALHYDPGKSELLIRESAQFRTIDRDGLVRTGGSGGKTAEELCKITGSGLAVTEDKDLLVARPTFIYRFGRDIVFYPPEGPNANPRAFEEIADIAYDPQSKSIYVADRTRIKRIALPDGTITTVAGTGSDEASKADGQPLETALGEVQAIAVDRHGNVYFAAGYPPIIRALGAPSAK